jgi:hypothetical protein
VMRDSMWRAGSWPDGGVGVLRVIALRFTWVLEFGAKVAATGCLRGWARRGISWCRSRGSWPRGRSVRARMRGRNYDYNDDQ